MGDLAKYADTLIKAPLWFFFALFVLTGSPLLGIPLFVHFGLKPDLTIFGMPIAFYALGSFSLLISSFTARAWEFFKISSAEFLKEFHWWWRIKRLPREARAILFVLEHQGEQSFYYFPKAPGLGALRDAGIVSVSQTSADGHSWGAYYLHERYKRGYRQLQGVFRSAIGHARSAEDEVRNNMRGASLANRR